MSFEQIAVLLLFVSAFALIISEKIDKMVVALAAALILVLSGFFSFADAIAAIDFDTIGLLLGMMLMVECLREIKIFDWASVQLGLLTGGNPILIFVVFGISTALFSAFLDNVTTILVMIPLVVALTKSVGVQPRVYVLTLIFMSNIGGTWTLIGDPPNILIGSQVPSLTFGAFMTYLGIPVFISAALIMCFMRRRYADDTSASNREPSRMFLSGLVKEQLLRQKADLRIDTRTLKRAAAVFAVVIAGFVTHSLTHLPAPAIALAGAVLMLITFRTQIEIHHILAKIEWGTLLFFAGLFVLVGAMEHAKLLTMLSRLLVSITSEPLALILIVLFSSALISGLVDNIPFVAVLIPVIKDLLMQEPFSTMSNMSLIWWALSLGSCFGGNATIVGASANVVGCAVAKQRGVAIGFRDFLRDSIPVTAISIAVSAVYLTCLYLAS